MLWGFPVKIPTLNSQVTVKPCKVRGPFSMKTVCLLLPYLRSPCFCEGGGLSWELFHRFRCYGYDLLHFLICSALFGAGWSVFETMRRVLFGKCVLGWFNWVRLVSFMLGLKCLIGRFGL